MAKGAQKPEKKEAKRRPPLRPVLLSLGLGLLWFVEFQDGGAHNDAPPWGYMIVVGARLFADFVGAWFVVSGLHLVFSVGRVAILYLHSLWMRESA
jgi:hypothetical protein